jgi:cobalt-zinc-cadmium efflux system outer membrane protein
MMLAQFWGKTEASFERLDGDLFDYEAAENFERLYERVKTSPAMEVFASETRMQEANVALARTKGRSDLNWQAGVRRFEESDDTGFVVGFSVPLFAGKRNRGDLNAALAARDSAQSARKFASLRLRGDLFQAYSLRNQNIEAVQKIKDTSIPALTSALKLTRLAYENGRYRYVELVAAQEELLATKQSLIDAASTALISQALIEKLTGQALNQ